MELPSRAKKDRYTLPGQYSEIERRLRANPATSRIPVLVCYAFDHRTRLGPFLFIDTRLLPAGPRAVGAALHSAGFTRTRVVQRQWTPNVRPSEARLDGEPPQMLFVSSMQIHSASAYDMIADAWKLGADRPLILAGGPKAIYEPWDFFGFEVGGRRDSADVVVTGEEFVALELLDRIMEACGRGEHPRKVFHRLRRSGLLDDIPGLVFRPPQWEESPEPSGMPSSVPGTQHLINTGIQRLVQDLDELPHPLIGLSLLEPPHRRHVLARRPIELPQLPRFASIVSLVTTHGCKFHCPYCPIPAYNQFTFRWKSPGRLRNEMETIAEKTGMNLFFGTDDNFFNNRDTVEEIFTELSRGQVHGKPFAKAVWFGTEATEFDVFKNQDLLPLARAGGPRAIWFGIEDMTAELVKKGQSPEKTKTLFEMLNRLGIAPMSMMMHHDGQPLYSRGQMYGLVNQVNFLRQTGSVSVQVTILTPSVGSKGYEEPYEKGLVIEKAGSEGLQDFQYDGNHCIATDDPHPWRKQLNIYVAYAGFYNPVNFIRALLNRKDPLRELRVLYQAYGMVGLVKSLAQSWRWIWGLFRGPVKKMTAVPKSCWEMIEPAAALAQALGGDGAETDPVATCSASVET